MSDLRNRIDESSSIRQSSSSAISVSLKTATSSEQAPPADYIPGRFGALSELRLDVLTGRQTIFATSRGDRPVETAPPDVVSEPFGICPFCEGNEKFTPMTLLSIPNDEDPDSWLVRVVDNKFPAVTWRGLAGKENKRLPSGLKWKNQSNRRSPQRRGSVGLFDSAPVAGGHEVVIESPWHSHSIVDLNVDHLAKVYQAIALRIGAWSKVPGVEYISVFKNVGSRAGASLSHAHSQLITTAALPPRVADTMLRSGTHFDQTGCCLQCDLLRSELETGQRIAFTTEHFVAYCPFASSLPYLTRILPRKHGARFEDSSPAVLADLAQLTRRLVQCFETLFPGVSYNYVLHTQPPGVSNEEPFHWSMEWMPRVTTQAGFEFASDCYINPTLPETAAAALREVARQTNPLRGSRPRTGHSVIER